MTNNIIIEIPEEKDHTEEEEFIQEEIAETEDDNMGEKEKAKVEKEAEVRKKAIDIQIGTLNIISCRGNRLEIACK